MPWSSCSRVPARADLSRGHVHRAAQRVRRLQQQHAGAAPRGMYGGRQPSGARAHDDEVPARLQECARPHGRRHHRQGGACPLKQFSAFHSGAVYMRVVVPVFRGCMEHSGNEGVPAFAEGGTHSLPAGRTCSWGSGGRDALVPGGFPGRQRAWAASSFARVFVAGSVHDGGRRALFDDPAAAQHDDPVADFRGQRQVVRDQQQRQPAFLADVPKQRQDSGLGAKVPARRAPHRQAAAEDSSPARAPARFAGAGRRRTPRDAGPSARDPGRRG